MIQSKKKIPERSQSELSEQISIYRYSGDLEEAVRVCKIGINNFPNNNFYYKVLGDLYFQLNEYNKASESYLEFLKRIDEDPALFSNFAKFVRRLEKSVDSVFIEKYKKKIMHCIMQNAFSIEVISKLVVLLNIEYLQSAELRENIEKTNDDRNFEQITQFIKDCEAKNLTSHLNALFEYTLLKTKTPKSRRVDKHIVSVMERWKRIEDALTIINDVAAYDDDEVTIRTLFRLCRKINDYKIAEQYLEKKPETISRGNFNIQYELVYYFKELNDQKALNTALEYIRNSAQNSLPISKTLYNFYLQFEMLDEAEKLNSHIQILKDQQAKRIAHKHDQLGRWQSEEESEEGVWEKLKNLMSEQEHTRQMIAMKELLKGFSHELGQPITNIRYSIQLFQRKITRGMENPEDLARLLNGILEQTERIGHLLSRFAPIVSSKSKETTFNVLNRIRLIFSELSTRLRNEGINYNIVGDENIILFGDAIQFDQIFYNLIINSIHAIGKKNKAGEINISLINYKTDIQIEFSDNGIGIPREIQRKIFEPFFSTKDKTKEEGGEGLGLFIIWNILKIFGGKISLDSKYNKGAKFIIRIPKRRDY